MSHLNVIFVISVHSSTNIKGNFSSLKKLFELWKGNFAESSICVLLFCEKKIECEFKIVNFEDTNDFNLILSIIQGFTEKVLNQTRT